MSTYADLETNSVHISIDIQENDTGCISPALQGKTFPAAKALLTLGTLATQYAHATRERDLNANMLDRVARALNFPEIRKNFCQLSCPSNILQERFRRLHTDFNQKYSDPYRRNVNVTQLLSHQGSYSKSFNVSGNRVCNPQPQGVNFSWRAPSLYYLYHFSPNRHILQLGFTHPYFLPPTALSAY
jgi:hypothetical protein